MRALDDVYPGSLKHTFSPQPFLLEVPRRPALAESVRWLVNSMPLGVSTDSKSYTALRGSSVLLALAFDSVTWPDRPLRLHAAEDLPEFGRNPRFLKRFF